MTVSRLAASLFRQPAGRRRKILFGRHDSWHAAIARACDPGRFDFAFLQDSDPSVAFDEYDLICPLQTSDYEMLRGALAAGRISGRNFHIPDAATVHDLDSKCRFAELMQAGGFGAFYPRWSESTGFPCIAKPEWGDYGRGCEIIRTGPDLERLRDRADMRYAVQRLIPGATEYATHILSHRGRIAAHFTIEYKMRGAAGIRGHLDRPVSIRRRKTPPCGRRVFSAILGAIGYTGTSCANYKIRGGQPMIFEINPRFGGSLVYFLNPYLEAGLALLPRG